eukprot:2689643-Rhodomonas_salina.3
MQCPVQIYCMLLSTYAISGTDVARGTICLRSCYAMSGTDLAYAATRIRRCFWLWVATSCGNLEIVFPRTQKVHSIPCNRCCHSVNRLLPFRVLTRDTRCAVLAAYARAMPYTVLTLHAVVLSPSMCCAILRKRMVVPDYLATRCAVLA